MSITFNSKKPSEIFFGNKSVAAVYRGNKLVWEKLVKQLESAFLHDQCFEFIPSEDIVLTDVEFFSANNSSDTHAKLRILNEAGICVVYRDENGVQLNVTVYNLTGSLKTFTSLGTVTLFKDNVYYINIKGPNTGEGDGSGMTGSKYIGFTGRQKSFSSIANVNRVYSSTAWQHTSVGSADSFSEICQKAPASNGSYFIWRGNSPGNNMMPQESGIGNPYPYLLKRDMRAVKRVFTDSDFGQSDDIARYAFIFYTMGNTPGDEFIMNVGDHFGQGFAVTPGSGNKNVFTNCKHKIYKLSGNMARNHITSMDPVSEEPSSKTLGDVYYKAAGVTWTGLSVSDKAVVAWNGGSWEIATNWTTEFEADSSYSATNYCEKISDNYAKDFNNVSVTTGDKLYFRLNGNEVF